jgi:hypothetical protein
LPEFGEPHFIGGAATDGGRRDPAGVGAYEGGFDLGVVADSGDVGCVGVHVPETCMAVDACGEHMAVVREEEGVADGPFVEPEAFQGWDVLEDGSDAEPVGAGEGRGGFASFERLHGPEEGGECVALFGGACVIGEGQLSDEVGFDVPAMS